jgi:hypothetical protein
MASDSETQPPDDYSDILDMAIVPFDGAIEQTAVEPPKKKRKLRGPVKCVKLVERHSKAKLPVEVDKEGNPKGDNAKDLSSFMGLLIRTNVPITYKDWRLVPMEIKMRMWEELMVLCS